MRCRWTVRRTMRPDPDGRRRWDRAYQEVLTWTEGPADAHRRAITGPSPRDGASAAKGPRRGATAALARPRGPTLRERRRPGRERAAGPLSWRAPPRRRQRRRTRRPRSISRAPAYSAGARLGDWEGACAAWPGSGRAARGTRRGASPS